MLRLLAPLIGGIANGSVKTAVKSTRDQAICYALVGIALFFALVFLCIIAFIMLTWITPPIWAASIICGFWFIVALLALLIGRLIANRRRKVYKKQMNDERSNLLVASAVAAVPAILGNKKILGIALPLIGIAALILRQADHKKQDS